MTETGKIREIRGNFAVIEADKGAACFGCMNVECKKGGFITAENALALPLKKGQKVEVSVKGAGLFRQTITAILPPILGFTGGYIFTRIAFPASSQNTAAMVGIALLFAASFGFYKIKRRPSAAGGYTVTRIIK